MKELLKDVACGSKIRLEKGSKGEVEVKNEWDVDGK